MPPGWWKWHCTDCGEQLAPGSHNEVRCWSCKDSDPEPVRSPFVYVPVTYRWSSEHRAKRRAEIRAESEAARAA